MLKESENIPQLTFQCQREPQIEITTSWATWAACEVPWCKLRVKFESPCGSCTTATLNDPEKENFEKGSLDRFSREHLGSCKDFDPKFITSVTFSHEGDDGWIGENLKIYLSKNRIFSCPLLNTLIQESVGIPRATFKCYKEGGELKIKFYFQIFIY